MHVESSPPNVGVASLSCKPGSRLRGLLLLAAVVVLALVVLAIHAVRYWVFLTDDAFISLRYAERLLQGHGLTWTDGEWVEGYSNLLWVLTAAALGATGLDLVDAVRVLGFAGMGTAAVAISLANPPRGVSTLLPAVAAGLALALTGSVAVWTIGGLEQPLVAALLAWALVLALRSADGPPSHPLLSGLPLALLCLTRPDAPVLVAGVGLGIVLARGVNRASAAIVLRLVVLPVLAITGQLAFRLAYYGDWLPNPARVKVALTKTRVLSGAQYVGEGVVWMLGLILLASLAVLPALVERGRRRRLLVLVGPGLLWAVYLVFVGGDSFPARRQFIPLVVVWALMASCGLAWLASRGPRRQAAAWIVVAVLLGVHGTLQIRDPLNRRLLEVPLFERDAKAVGLFLGEAFGSQRPLLAVDAAGALVYFSRLPALDMLGLNDRYLALHPPPSFGRGLIGHELGDGRYVMKRRPDLVILCGPTGRDQGCFRSGRELLGLDEFRSAYVAVPFIVQEPHPYRSLIWIRKEGRIGIQRGDRSVVIPGFLLTGSAENVAGFDSGRRLGVVVSPVAGVSLRNLRVSTGQWRVDAEYSGAAPTLTITRDGLRIGHGFPGADFAGTDTDEVTIEVAAPEGLSHVRRLTLTTLP